MVYFLLLCWFSHAIHAEQHFYRKAAVAADTKICSKIGADILRRNGSAVDSAVATTFCLGVVQLHSCGIGGGGFMVVYERKKLHVYDYRETAPSAAAKNMFVGDELKSQFGGLAVGVPGMVRGLWTAHQNHGRLGWSELIKPAYRLARDGVVLSDIVRDNWQSMLLSQVKRKQISKPLRDLFTDPKTGMWIKAGELVFNPELAHTLKYIAATNDTGFYEGSLADDIVREVAEASGILTHDDLRNYKVKKREILSTELRGSNFTLNMLGAPGGGEVLNMILNIIEGYDSSEVNIDDKTSLASYYHQIIESFKFAYARRANLCDPGFCDKKAYDKAFFEMTDKRVADWLRKFAISDSIHEPSYYGNVFSKSDHGTTHFSVLSENGDAVSATHSLNEAFGGLMRSAKTGIIYNDVMDDFSTPNTTNHYGFPSAPANFIRPGKRPLSSMTPSIITDVNGDVRMVVGASGGSEIPSALAQVMVRNLYLRQNLNDSVTAWRIHNQNIPPEVKVNPLFPPPEELLVELRALFGQDYYLKKSFSVVQAILKESNGVRAVCDYRKHGEPDGY